MSVWRVTIKETMAEGCEARQVFHYEYTPGLEPGHSTWLGLATALATAIGACIDVSANIYGYTVHLWLEDTKRWNLVDEGELTIPGLREGNSLPYQIAAVVLGYTNLSRHIAKKWLGPISGSDQDGGVVVQGLKTVLEAFAVAWQTPYTAGGVNLNPVSWSKTGGPLGLREMDVDDVLGTQRRRKPGKGI